MTKWNWWASTNSEDCTVGPCATREEVIQTAVNDELGADNSSGRRMCYFAICEAQQEPLRLADWIDADRLLEMADENAAESDKCACDEAPIFERSTEQEADFILRIKRACDEWQDANELVFTPRTFSAVRNWEEVTVEIPEEESK